MSILINKTRLGQVRSIDRAYQKVSTKYVFHCEDDWLFYRSGFIEESIKIMATDKRIFSVWLRSYYNDLLHYSDGYDIFLGDGLTIDHSVYRRIYSKRENNQCFSFNPSLREYKHYPKDGYASLLNTNKYVENVASGIYESQGMYSVLLENSAVNHLGFGRQVLDIRGKIKRRKKLLTHVLIAIFIFFAVCHVLD